MNLAIVGATGLVGQTILQVLRERHFSFDNLYLVASAKSKGKPIAFNGCDYIVESLEEFDPAKVDVAIFSAGGRTSLKYAPVFAKHDVFVIDNSSAWRMEPDIPLVVPEINAQTISPKTRIIANPNCSTIQMVMALKPLHDAFGLKKIKVCTYQSVTGAGYKAVNQLEKEIKGDPIEEKAFPHQIAFNCIPHIDVFYENGFTKEELKMVYETQKILDDDSIEISPTAVRLPVIGGHSEAIAAEFIKEPDIKYTYQLLEKFPGITVVDDVMNNTYPMPITAHNRDDVFVGRIRRDLFNPHILHLWVVADNLRKGAATNAVQIAEYLVRKNFIH